MQFFILYDLEKSLALINIYNKDNFINHNTVSRVIKKKQIDKPFKNNEEKNK